MLLLFYIVSVILRILKLLCKMPIKTWYSNHNFLSTNCIAGKIFHYTISCKNNFIGGNKNKIKLNIFHLNWSKMSDNVGTVTGRETVIGIEKNYNGNRDVFQKGWVVSERKYKCKKGQWTRGKKTNSKWTPVLCLFYCLHWHLWLKYIYIVNSFIFLGAF